MYRTVILPVLIAGSLLVFAGCFNRATVQPEASPEQKAVEKYIKRMIASDEEGEKKMISPEWLEENDLDIDDYQVNSYSPEDYEIMKVKGSKVTAEIIFKDGDAHRLVFKVSKEKGKYYIVPGTYDEDEWIHPWQSVETSVRK
jgi:hypothetical protein